MATLFDRQTTVQILPVVSEAANTVPVLVGFEEGAQQREKLGPVLAVVQLAGSAQGGYFAVQLGGEAKPGFAADLALAFPNGAVAVGKIAVAELVVFVAAVGFVAGGASRGAGASAAVVDRAATGMAGRDLFAVIFAESLFLVVLTLLRLFAVFVACAHQI